MTDAELEQGLAELEAARARIFAQTPAQRAAAAAGLAERIAAGKVALGAVNAADWERGAKRQRRKAERLAGRG